VIPEPRELRTEEMLLNMGPQHPSTHGVLRLVVRLSGEEVLDVVPHIGYLHTGFEKTMENRTYHQNLTFTPRMDYLHSFAHDLAYALSVEKLVGAEVPERARVIRVILNELSRIASHLIFVATGLLDLGALTPFFYAFREREAVLDLEEFVPELKKFLDAFDHRVDDYQGLFVGSPIFEGRARGVGVISPEDAIAYGLTGGSLRASGVNYDVRKAYPYCGYETYDFEVPLGERGAATRTPTSPSPPGNSSPPRWRRSSTTSSWPPRASRCPPARPTCPPKAPAASSATT